MLVLRAIETDLRSRFVRAEFAVTGSDRKTAVVCEFAWDSPEAPRRILFAENVTRI
jgi:hypothetical protein